MQILKNTFNYPFKKVFLRSSQKAKIISELNEFMPLDRAEILVIQAIKQMKRPPDSVSIFNFIGKLTYQFNWHKENFSSGGEI